MVQNVIRYSLEFNIEISFVCTDKGSPATIPSSLCTEIVLYCASENGELIYIYLYIYIGVKSNLLRFRNPSGLGRRSIPVLLLALVVTSSAVGKYFSNKRFRYLYGEACKNPVVIESHSHLKYLIAWYRNHRNNLLIRGVCSCFYTLLLIIPLTNLSPVNPFSTDVMEILILHGRIWSYP